MTVTVRFSGLSDIADMVKLSAEKRQAYEKIQPQFWRSATDANAKQTDWFSALLLKQEYIMLCAEDNGHIIGFVIGQIISAPAVYEPGGFTIMVDDFCVKAPLLWPHIGRLLIDDLKIKASSQGVTQIVIVCGAHDVFKQQFINSLDLSVASHWYCGSI